MALHDIAPPMTGGSYLNLCSLVAAQRHTEYSGVPADGTLNCALQQVTVRLNKCLRSVMLLTQVIDVRSRSGYYCSLHVIRVCTRNHAKSVKGTS